MSKNKIHFLTLKDKNYPPLLTQISNPPSILFFRGKIPSSQKAIAVIGSRKATAYGKKIAQKFTHQLVKKGFVIVSGLAIGIDAIAHQTAINSNGKTIAVLGTGVDIIYPQQNTRLYHQIIKKNGAVISEFPPQTKPKRKNFPQRNRIISGLCLGVLVIEAAEKSGTKITARFAADQGREVFAVPGPVNSPLSSGTADLIKQGAKLVYSLKDILEELP